MPWPIAERSLRHRDVYLVHGLWRFEILVLLWQVVVHEVESWETTARGKLRFSRLCAVWPGAWVLCLRWCGLLGLARGKLRCSDLEAFKPVRNPMACGAWNFHGCTYASSATYALVHGGLAGGKLWACIVGYGLHCAGCSWETMGVGTTRRVLSSEKECADGGERANGHTPKKTCQCCNRCFGLWRRGRNLLVTWYGDISVALKIRSHRTGQGPWETTAAATACLRYN